MTHEVSSVGPERKARGRGAPSDATAASAQDRGSSDCYFAPLGVRRAAPEGRCFVGHWHHIWRRTAAAALLPLVLCAGTSLVVELMSCRAMGTLVSHCCCPAPALRVALDPLPRLEQGCCEGLQLRVSAADPLPSCPLREVPPPSEVVLGVAPRHDAFIETRPDSLERRRRRAFDPTGPPPRLLHCTLLL